MTRNDLVSPPISGHGNGNHVGGILNQETPVICNLVSDDLGCYGYFPSTPSKWTKIASLDTMRQDAASLVIDSSTLWITGGKTDNSVSDDSTTDSTVYLTLTSMTAGPKMPVSFIYHCMVMLDIGSAMVIGGIAGTGGDGRSTLYYNFQTEHWYNAPPLETGRFLHKCATLHDFETQAQ